MKKLIVGAVIVFFVFISLFAYEEKGSDEQNEAIKKAALDYIEGWFEGSGERMDRALHPELAKRLIYKDAKGKDVFRNLTKAEMVKATEGGGGKGVPADQRQIKVTILDIYKTIATVKVESVSFIDYLHLGKTGGEWKIVNVLWLPNVKERETAQIDPKIFIDYVGEYELAPGFTITVTTENDRLIAQGTGQPAVELFPESETKFFLKEVEAQVDFVRDEQGKVTHLILNQGGRQTRGNKVK